MLSCQHLPVNQTCTKPEVHSHCLLSGYSAVTPQKEHLLGNTKCSVLPMLFTVLMGKSILELFKYSLSIQLSQASGNSTTKTGSALLTLLLSLALSICISYSSTTVLPTTGILLVHRTKLRTSLSLLSSNRLSKKKKKGMPKQQGNILQVCSPLYSLAKCILVLQRYC